LPFYKNKILVDCKIRLLHAALHHTFFTLSEFMFLPVLPHVLFHVIPVPFSMFFPVKLQIFLVPLAPFEGAMTACLFPGRVLALFVFKIIGIPGTPDLHILELALILAFERRADRLIGPVLVWKERLAANFAYFFFWHTLPRF